MNRRVRKRTVREAATTCCAACGRLPPHMRLRWENTAFFALVSRLSRALSIAHDEPGFDKPRGKILGGSCGNHCKNTVAQKRKKWKVTSPTLGTGGKRLWLLRSRPDQVDRPSMRGGPSRRILTLVALQCEYRLWKSRLRRDSGTAAAGPLAIARSASTSLA
jgi:hypothetical protein